MCYASSCAQLFPMRDFVQAVPKLIRPTLSYLSPVSPSSSQRGALGPSGLKAMFDIDPVAGSTMPRGLPKLGRQYSIWEDALAESQVVLSLGEDESPDAVIKRPSGEKWRAQIRSVRFS